MSRYSIDVTFAVDDSNVEYELENEDAAWEELAKAIGDLPPTVGISNVENQGENQ